MNIKDKRILKNGAVAGYVKQIDGSWKWRILNGPSKNKGGKKIKDSRLEKLVKNINYNKNNATLENKLKNLKLSLKQKHLASPKVLRKHNNKVYNKMYKNLNDILENKSKTNKEKVKEFLNPNREKRIQKSIKKWEKKKCKTRRCKKQKVATKLLKNDINKIKNILNKKNDDDENTITSKLQKINNVLSNPEINTNKLSINTKVKVKKHNTNLSIYKNNYNHRKWYIYRLINIYKNILNRVLNDKTLNLNQLSFPNINRFIDLLMKVDINLSEYKINSSKSNFGHFIIIRHTETLENLIDEHTVIPVGLALTQCLRDSKISRHGLYMIENVYEQLIENEKLRQDIINNFPLLLTSRKKRTHRTANGTIQKIFNEQDSTFNSPAKDLSRFIVYLFDEPFADLHFLDPSIKLKEKEIYNLSDIFLSCLPTNNFIISGHSHWFQHFFSQKKNEKLSQYLNPKKKMFNVQGLLYQYHIKNSKLSDNNFRESFKFIKCLFQPIFNERQQKIANKLKKINHQTYNKLSQAKQCQLNQYYFTKIQENVQKVKNSQVNNNS